MVNECKECGCMCKKCVVNDHDVHLHVEIENLKQKLVEREHHIVTMETNFLNEANKFPSGELVALREELLTWQDKYRRLHDAHRRVQRVNQGLEDKLLKLVDVCETEKTKLTKDVAMLSKKLAEANYIIKKLTDDNERYKDDVSLAIQFLQCKRSNFVAQKYDSLPQEVQSQVSSFMTNKRKPEEKKISYEMKSIKVPIPTFPPTAMVYSIPKSPKSDRKMEVEAETPQVDIVSAAIMAKVLEERQKDKAFAKHCETCTCSKRLSIVCETSASSVGTQTGDPQNSPCLRCNENLPPQRMRLVRNEAAVKIVPSEPTDATQISGNVVKVQPNNFLTHEMSPLNNLSNAEVKANPDFFSTNEALQVKSSKRSPKMGATAEGAKRLQGGTRNILLDNAHDNVASVLYKHHKIKREDTPTTHQCTSHTDSSSSDDFKNVSVSDCSTHSQQRVADWIRNNLENEISNSDSSQRESVIAQRSDTEDKMKYMEMEEHVKRFLFGESEFLKSVNKVAAVSCEGNDCDRADNNKSGPLTETEI